MAKILLVEDSVDIVALIRANLSELGFAVELEVAEDGREGIERGLDEQFALYILDVDLPFHNGFEVCRSLRQNGVTAPVLMLTGCDAVEQKIEGLEAGADDYLTKPFSTAELFARIRAILRRSSFDPLAEAASDTQPAYTPQFIIHAELKIDPDTREVSRGGESVKLSKNEFDALLLLASHPGRVFSRAELLREVLGYENPAYESNINTLMTRLRHKVETDSSNPRFIKTEWGVGYRFANQEELE